MRVVFRDENGDSVRGARGEDIETAKFVDTRFGNFMRYGMDVCGRQFDFLAYSSSALKEQTVFFVSVFDDAGELVTADSIRESLGDFTKVSRNPG